MSVLIVVKGESKKIKIESENLKLWTDNGYEIYTGEPIVPDERKELLNVAIELKLTSKSILNRWSTTRLRKAIKEAGNVNTE